MHSHINYYNKISRKTRKFSMYEFFSNIETSNQIAFMELLWGRSPAFMELLWGKSLFDCKLH